MTTLQELEDIDTINRLLTGETIACHRHYLSTITRLAERASEQCRNSNGIIIYGDDNNYWKVHVKLWLLNTV